MENEEKKPVRTSVHLMSDKLEAIGLLKIAYTYKTKKLITRQDFFDYMIEATKEKVDALPVTEIVDGKIVYKKEEQWIFSFQT